MMVVVRDTAIFMIATGLSDAWGVVDGSAVVWCGIAVSWCVVGGGGVWLTGFVLRGRRGCLSDCLGSTMRLRGLLGWIRLMTVCRRVLRDRAAGRRECVAVRVVVKRSGDKAQRARWGSQCSGKDLDNLSNLGRDIELVHVVFVEHAVQAVRLVVGSDILAAGVFQILQDLVAVVVSVVVLVVVVWIYAIKRSAAAAGSFYVCISSSSCDEYCCWVVMFRRCCCFCLGLGVGHRCGSRPGMTYCTRWQSKHDWMSSSMLDMMSSSRITTGGAREMISSVSSPASFFGT
eukprot:6476018-Amphidinium_carterae.3